MSAFPRIATVRRIGAVSAAAAGLAALGVGCGSAGTPTLSANEAALRKPAPTGQIVILAPAADSSTDAAKIELRGWVTPGDAAIAVRGRATAVSSGIFHRTVHLVPGLNRIDVVASKPGTQPLTKVLVVSRSIFDPRAASPQVLRGDATENVGDIRVPVDSTLHWSCSSCAGTEFAIDNDAFDANVIAMNAVGPSSGQTVVPAGVYHNVTVVTDDGGWALRITPGTAAPARSGPTQTLRGNGMQNVGNITVPVDSTVRWSCPNCDGNLFTIDSNPLGHNPLGVAAGNATGGQAAIAAGTYYDVTVDTGGGDWSLTITPRR